MKFVSRYLIMNTNLNKKTIPFTYFKRIYSSAGCIQVGLAHNALALDHCALANRTGIQMYRCGSVHVSCFHLKFSSCMLWWCLRWISHVSENEGLGSLESKKTMEKYFIIIFKNVKKKWMNYESYNIPTFIFPIKVNTMYF